MTSRRLVDLHPVGSEVCVLFGAGTPRETWVPGRVAAHAFPGVWVEAPGGSRWFVTNGGRIRARTEAPAAVVLKIATEDEWAATERTGAYPGSPADLRDGFIHFSTAAQVRETARRHFAGRTDLLLLEVDVAALDRASPGALRWEPSRGGELFPHLYAPLLRGAVVRARRLATGADGVAVFPPDVAAP